MMVVFFIHIIIWQCLTIEKTKREFRRICLEFAEPKPFVNFCIIESNSARKRFVSFYIEVTVGNVPKDIEGAKDKVLPKIASV